MSLPPEEPVNRKQLATFRDVYRIQKSIEEETIRLAGGDGSYVVACFACMAPAFRDDILPRFMGITEEMAEYHYTRRI